MRLQRPNRGFPGRDASRWVRGVAHDARIRYQGVCPGIDLMFRRGGGDGRLEYDWVVALGGDPREIRVKFDRAADLRDGDLIVVRNGFEWRHRKPEAYQPAGGGETQVTAAFRVYAKGESGFEVGRSVRTRTLIIDPVLASSLNFGGIGVESLVAGVGDMGNAIALGPASLGGNIYVAGVAATLDFPPNDSGFGVHKQGTDAFVAVASKDPTLGSLSISAVYFLGGSGDDAATGVAIDSEGNVYVTGYTDSSEQTTVG